MRKLPFPFTLALSLLAGQALAEIPDEPLPALSDLPPEPEPEPEPSPPPASPAPAPTPTPASPASPASPAPAPTPSPTPPPPAPGPAPALTWDLSAGLRVAYISSPGFDAFATNDALPLGSFSVGRTVYRRDRLSLAPVAGFDVGHRGASARGQETNLTVLSFKLGPEARYHFGDLAWLHLRPSFDVTRTLGSIDETSSHATFHARNWHVGFDVMAGGAFSLGAFGEGETRAWLVAEGGYTWSSSGSLAFRPDEGDAEAPHRAASLDLGDLALRGPAFRIAAALTF